MACLSNKLFFYFTIQKKDFFIFDNDINRYIKQFVFSFCCFIVYFLHLKKKHKIKGKKT